MLDNNKKQERPIKKETIYTNYLKRQQDEKFKLRDNIIPADLRKKLAETLHTAVNA